MAFSFTFRFKLPMALLVINKQEDPESIKALTVIDLPVTGLATLTVTVGKNEAEFPPRVQEKAPMAGAGAAAAAAVEGSREPEKCNNELALTPCSCLGWWGRFELFWMVLIGVVVVVVVGIVGSWTPLTPLPDLIGSISGRT